MKRKDYRKPAMKVVELQHTGMLMVSTTQSGRSAKMSVEYDEEDI